MGFDVEIIVLLIRAGSAIVNVPVGVRYLNADEGGVSHFRVWRDNVHFSWMHCRLCTGGLVRWIFDRLTGRRAPRPEVLQ